MRSLDVANGMRLCVVLGSFVILIGSTSAAEETAKTSESPPEPVAPAPSAEEGIRAQLDGTRWLLQLTPLSGDEKAKPQKDTVTFVAKQVSSERLSKAGFPTSNYTLTIGGDGVAVWETMQTKESAGVAFWRGELHGSTMRGVLSKHPAEGNPEDFSFTGQEASGKAIAVSGTSQPSQVSATRSTPASAAQTQVTTPTQTTKKKKQKQFSSQ